MPPDSAPDLAAQQTLAEQVLQAEAKAVGEIKIRPAFHKAVELVLSMTGEGRNGSVVVSGLGKSGLIGAKLSATLASTGTPSHFLHPTEAMHGDLGRVRHQDVVLILSYGGSNEEIVGLASILRQDGVSVIGIVGCDQSELGKLVTVALTVGVVEEACPLNLAPTTSATAMLALGDALALCVMRRRKFGMEDFRKRHPGGALGRQLMPVVQAMRFRAGQNVPLIRAGITIEAAYAETERYEGTTGLRRAGAVLVVDAKGHLAGIFTDGDLRRSLAKYGSDAYHRPIDQFMTVNPMTLGVDTLVLDAVRLVRKYRYDEFPVVDGDGRPLGLIDVQDLMALKVIEG